MKKEAIDEVRQLREHDEAMRRASTQYRKKPVVIDAVQFTGHNAHEISDGLDMDPVRVSYADPDNPVIIIETLEGTMRGAVGDWIIKGVREEFYPCKPDIFAATYEPA